MNIKRLNIGALGTNCYCVSGDGFAFVVDPADISDELIAFAKENALKQYKYILLTHCHIDHIMGAYAVKEKWDCPIVISNKDSAALKDPEYNLSRMIFGQDTTVNADMMVDDGDEINLGSEKISVMATPGHTPGSVCYIIGENMFSGDTIFKNSIGRTDFPRSNKLDMIISLSNLSSLQTDYKVYPGHNESTTLYREKKNNPYMR